MHELLEAGDRLVERHPRVGLVGEVEVDAIDAEALEAALDLAPDPVRREAASSGSPTTGLKTFVVSTSPSGWRVARQRPIHDSLRPPP